MSNNAGSAREISRADVEKAAWQLTGWQGDQVAIDGLLLVMDAWVASAAETLAHSPDSFRDGYYHSLVTMAEAILDTGGRMRLVPPEAEPVLRLGEVDALAEAILRKLPEIQREHEDAELLADPDLAESLAQMRNGQLAEEITPEQILAQADEAVARIEKRAAEEADWDENITCTRCGKDKHYLEFHKDAKGKHGRKARCKECESAKNKKVA